MFFKKCSRSNYKSPDFSSSCVSGNPYNNPGINLAFPDCISYELLMPKSADFLLSLIWEKHMDFMGSQEILIHLDYFEFDRKFKSWLAQRDKAVNRTIKNANYFLQIWNPGISCSLYFIDKCYSLSAGIHYDWNKSPIDIRIIALIS